MNNYDNLANEVEELKKQISYISKNVIPEIESKLDGESGETTSQENWTTIYDKDSDDVLVNISKTSGIQGSTGILADFPDLMPYTELKVLFNCNAQIAWYSFDISDTSDNSFRMISCSATLASLFNMTFTIAIRNNKRIIEFGNATKVDFYTTKYTAITNLKTNAYYHIDKILAR